MGCIFTGVIFWALGFWAKIFIDYLRIKDYNKAIKEFAFIHKREHIFFFSIFIPLLFPFSPYEFFCDKSKNCSWNKFKLTLLIDSYLVNRKDRINKYIPIKKLPDFIQTVFIILSIKFLFYIQLFLSSSFLQLLNMAYEVPMERKEWIYLLSFYKSLLSLHLSDHNLFLNHNYFFL